MAQEMIKKIKEAENASFNAVKSAEEKAKDILKEATQKINGMNKEFRDECETTKTQKLRDAHAEAEKIKIDYEKQATCEVVKISEIASQNELLAIDEAMKVLLS